MNVVKHAQAQRVIVDVAVVDHPEGMSLVDVVADDGVGLGSSSKADRRDGFGMRMIAARVEEVGGAWRRRQSRRRHRRAG